MSLSLKKALGGSAVRPIGSHVWFPNVDNPQVNPLIVTDTATYLRSGHVLYDEEENYPEAYETFATREEPNGAKEWIPIDAGFGGTAITSIAYGNGLWVAAGWKGKLATSEDGITWTQRDSGFGSSDIYTVCYGDGLWVAMGRDRKQSTSVDGITWVTANNPDLSLNIYAVSYGNGLWVAAGDSVFTSPDASTWTRNRSFLGSYFYRAIAYNPDNDIWMIAGNNYTHMSFDGGITWEQSSNITGPLYNRDLKGLVYGNGVWTTVSASHATFRGIYTSEDGYQWETKNLPITGVGSSPLAYGNGLLVLGGVGGGLYTSNDGANTWDTSESPFGSSTIQAISFGHDRWIAVGNEGKLAISLLTKTIGIPQEETQGDAIKYMRIK